MLSKERNELLTQVGPGTKNGELMRRYWHPVALASDLEEWPSKAVRLLGEDLVLFRDGNGQLGLVERKCPHRGASLAYGVVEEEGLRCGYHGWLWDSEGSCLHQPGETDKTGFKVVGACDVDGDGERAVFEATQDAEAHRVTGSGIY